MQDRGAVVVVIDRPTDLVVGYKGTWTFAEIKSGPRAKLRKSQKSFLQRCALQGLPCVLIDHQDDIDHWWPVSTPSDDRDAAIIAPRGTG